jgi:outer membrane receptor for ferrienterochelin and colicins
MRGLSSRRMLSFLLCIGSSVPVFAQTGAIAGRVTSASTGEPVARANVQALVGTERRASATADDSGRYRISALPAGRYTVAVSRVGDQVRRLENVVVRDGETTTVDIMTAAAAIQLEQVVTSATGRPDKVVDAPADVSIVTQQAVAARPSLTVADHIKAMPGVDVSTGGLVQSNIVTRGFNNAFSGTLLTLQDYRFATVPSLRVNVPFLFTSINEDIERIEVVLGPSAALYGPNSSAGVLHIVTRAPFDSPGTTLTLDGGSRSVARASLRNAGIINPKVGYKISGEVMRGDDWHYTDPGEPTTLMHNGKAVTRDFDVNRYAGEARLDLRPRPGMELTSTYGLTHAGGAIELTGANGAAQVKNWQYQSLQQRFRWGNLFAQAFLNSSDAGNKDSLDQSGTFLLRTGQAIVDQSRVGAGSIQHSFDFGERQRFIYGGDYTWTNPRTGGTIDGRNEDDDNVTEYGAYVHSLTRLSPRWEFTAALRADRNSRLDGTFFSPRAALVFKATESQNFRFTYNRAYSTPANFSMFLDLIQLRNAGGLPYDVRAMGVPPDGGWDYRRTCASALAGGLCMRSPFGSSLGAANSFVDANAAAYYQAALAIVKPQLPASIAGLVPILNALNPTSTQVGSVLHWLVGSADAVNPASLTPIEPLKASFVNNYELGYKGLIGSGTRVSVSGWSQERINFVTAAQISTPSVFLDPTTLGAYLGAQITAALVAQGLPLTQAQATAAAAVPGITAGLAKVPLGTITFDNAKLANRPDVMFTYRNVDKTITLMGLDFGFDQTLTDRFSLEGTYSHVDKESFPEIDGGGGQPLRLNSPKNKGSLAGHFNDERRGFKAELRARHADGFAVNSGVYTSGVDFSVPGKQCVSEADTPDACYQYSAVPSATLIDAGFSLAVPRLGNGASWSVNATNLLNHKTPTFIGVPSLGLLVMTRLQYNF